MDFLPHPTTGVEPLDVAFVAETPFVFGSSFWEFPKTHGFGDQWNTLPAPRLAELAQSWLYFGTISEFLGRPIDYREFRVSRSVSARPLLPLLSDWLASHAGRLSHPRSSQSRNDDDEDDEVLQQREVLYGHIKFLDEVLRLADDFEGLSQSHVTPLPAVILSVKVLCISIRAVLLDLVGARPDPSRQEAVAMSLLSSPTTADDSPIALSPASPSSIAHTLSLSLTPSAQLLLNVMHLRGWCPFYIRKVLTSYNHALAYYFTRLFRRQSPDLDHRDCSETLCVAGNVDLAAYVPKHTRPNCRCRRIGAPADEIRAVLEDGGIPLVRFHVSKKRELELRVTRMTASTRFVAISHGWHDGMGNVSANALPECQLRRLYGHLQNLEALRPERNPDAELNLLGSLDTGFQAARAPKPRYLWIDTLCLPSPCGLTSEFLRTRAVNKLPVVYQAADRVLVLDSTLERIKMSETNSLEQLARLLVSPWVRRAWTFHEAAMASVCEVQCEDGTFDPFTLQPSQTTTQTSTSQHNNAGGRQQRQNKWSDLLAAPALWAGDKLSRKSHHLVNANKSEPQRTTGGARRSDGTPKTASSGSLDFVEAVGMSLARLLRRDFRSEYANGVKASKAIFGEATLATDFCTLFVQAWNQLSGRAASVESDVHVVLAQTLGFHAEPMMKIPTREQRMASLLRSMDGIPMSIFFQQEAPRRDPIGRHCDRWMPLFPAGKLQFGSTFTNVRSINGSLYLPNNSVSRTKVAVLVCIGQTNASSTVKFAMRDASSGEQYYVQEHRDLERIDAFAPTRIGPYCIAIQLDAEAPSFDIGTGNPLKSFPGALFRIRKVATRVRKRYHHNLDAAYDDSFELVEEEEEEGSGYDRDRRFEPKNKGAQILMGDYTGGDPGLHMGQHERGIFRAVYDCPVTVSHVVNIGDLIGLLAKEEEAGISTLAAQPLPEGWQVVIEQQPPTHPVPLPSRPNFSEAMTPVTAYLSVTALDGLVASGCVGFGIAVCVTAFGSLAAMARAAVIAKLVLHSLFLVQMFVFAGVEVRLVWDVLHLALIAIYTVSRVQSGSFTGTGNVGDTTRVLDWAFVVWSVVGHTADIMGRLAIRGVVVPALFEQYVASFDGEGLELLPGGGGAAMAGGGFGRWYHRARLKARRRLANMSLRRSRTTRTVVTGELLEPESHAGLEAAVGVPDDPRVGPAAGIGRRGMPEYWRQEQRLLGDIGH